MVLESLLLKLNSMVYTAQANADNLVIVIRGKYFSTVEDLMQGSLKVWSTGIGLKDDTYNR